MEMNFELLRVAVALIGTAMIAYQDYKTSFIDDKIVYTMIAGGLLFNLLTADFTFISFAVGGAVLIGAVGYFIFKQGQFGAGDILLFTALQLLLPFAPLEFAKTFALTPIINSAAFLSASQVFPFFFSTFITSSILALIGSSAMYAYKLRELKVKWKPDYVLLAILSIVMVACIFWFCSFVFTEARVLHLVVFCLIALAAIFSTSMKEQIMNEIIVQHIAINKIEDEDILATERMEQKIVEKYKLERVLTAENLAKLKTLQREKKMKLFPVYKNLPRFAPYILAGLLLSLFLVSPIAFVLFY